MKNLEQNIDLLLSQGITVKPFSLQLSSTINQSSMVCINW